MIDLGGVAEQFRAQDELILVRDAIPPARLAAVRAEADALEPSATRVHVPFVRRAGTIGAGRLRTDAPAITALYGELRALAEQLAGRPLYEKDPDDDHAFALYCYRAGDFMASHFDRCGDPAGASYSVTVGIIDTSRAMLECEISRGRMLSFATPPGSLTIYNGSRVAHAVSTLGRGERRIVLSGSYRTQPSEVLVPHATQRIVEGLLYFGRPGRERRS